MKTNSLIMVTKDRLLRLLVCLIAALCLFGGRVFADLPPNRLEQLSRSAVWVHVESPTGISNGSGFFIRDDLIVTSAQVLAATEPWFELTVKVEVVFASGTNDQKVIPCTVASVDAARDIAFLSVPRQTQAHTIELLKGDSLRENMLVHVLGFPGDGRPDNRRKLPGMGVFSGRISALSRDEGNQLEKLQVHASPIAGCVGGPVVNDEGKLIGISQSIATETKLDDVIPADHIAEDMLGSVSAFLTSTDDDQHTIKIKLRCVDPLQQITKMAVYYWTRDKDAEPTNAAGLQTPAHGLPGDSRRQYVQLTNETGDIWIGTLPQVEVPTDKELWMQLAIAKGKQVRLLRPINHSRRNAANQAAMASLPDASKSSQTKTSTEKNQDADKANPVAITVSPNRFAFKSADRELAKALNLETRSEHLQISVKPIVDVVAAAQGHCFYVLVEGEPQVWVYDSGELKLLSKIDVARAPRSIGCYRDKLAVACYESKTVQFIEMKTQEVVHAARVPESEWMPTTIVGEAPDGSLMTLWSKVDDPATKALYLVDLHKPPLKLITGAMDWCTVVPGNELVIVQADPSEAGGPGLPMAWTVNDPPKKTMPGFIYKGKPILTDKAGRQFFDRQTKLMFTPLFDPLQSGQPRVTYIQKEQAKKGFVRLPGFAMPHRCAGNNCVSFDFEWLDNSTDGIVNFCDTNTGEVNRRVRIKDMPTSMDYLFDFTAKKQYDFVPGRLLMLIADPETDGLLHIAPCAPGKR